MCHWNRHTCKHRFAAFTVLELLVVTKNVINNGVSAW